MFEQFLAVLVRIAVALESLASAGGLTTAPATNVAADETKEKVTEQAKKDVAKTDAPKTGRGRARANTADTGDTAGAGAGDTAGAAGAGAAGRGRRTRSGAAENKPVEETAEIKAAREQITNIGVSFAEYADLTSWVQDYLKGKGWENITQIPAAQVLEVCADFTQKENDEFGAE